MADSDELQWLNAERNNENVNKRTCRRAYGVRILRECCSAFTSQAQTQSRSLKERNHWHLVCGFQYVDQDGKKLGPFGSNPKGLVVYDSHGRFMLILQRASLPHFASSNRMTGTPEDQAIVQGSIAYFGTYVVDEAGRKINLNATRKHFPKLGRRRI